MSQLGVVRSVREVLDISISRRCLALEPPSIWIHHRVLAAVVRYYRVTQASDDCNLGSFHTAVLHRRRSAEYIMGSPTVPMVGIHHTGPDG